jgi:AcrR family transcriptional regulator
MTGKPLDRTPPHAEPRRPQQERGQRRVDAILDAAATLIAEEGIAGATMLRVAQLSHTTTGSMYHFFPDGDALLRALAERHASQLRELTANIERGSAAEWAQLSTAEAVDQFLDPFLAYIKAHPDLLPVTRRARTAGWTADRDAELDRQVIRLAETVVASRCSKATPMERMSRALTMTAMVEGVVGAAARSADVAHEGMSAAALSDAALQRELRRALVAYLDSYSSPASCKTRD